MEKIKEKLGNGMKYGAVPWKGTLCLALLVMVHLPMFPQTSDLTTKLQSWEQDIKTILNAVVGIFAFVGGFLIFIQYMQGNEQAQKNFIRFVIGLAIFGLVAFMADIFLSTDVR